MRSVPSDGARRKNVSPAKASGASSPCAACTIRDMSVCAALNESELLLLREIATDIKVAGRKTIIQEGEPAQHLFNVTGGAVKLYKLLADGRRQITGFLFPGDFLGLALNDNYAYSAEAISEVCLCRFPRRKLEGLLDRFPKMERRLLGMASNELAAAQDQMLLLGRKTAAEKVASFLLLLSHRATERGWLDNPVSLPMTRSDIGDCLGLTIETVSRIITRFKKSGLISMAHNDLVTIERRNELQRIAESI